MDRVMAVSQISAPSASTLCCTREDCDRLVIRGNAVHLKRCHGVRLSQGQSRRGKAQVSACANETSSQAADSLPRRQMIAAFTALLAANASSTGSANAAGGIPKGFQVLQDPADGYQFLYPFGWQEVLVKGQDVVFKDVIEPLESVSVTVLGTERESLAELGKPEEVATALVERVLTGPSQKPKLVSVKERTTDGNTYLTIEYTAQAPNYTRHALSTVAINKGKFYTLTTGANERRWTKVADKLQVVVDSFSVSPF
eukprot:TRINITY_DN2299_c0_g1_i1.p1 TRINITY_DN2299_c0_g1~~TRINITY_DN2299_c0_g1_i1.p1  ORF type:complete len:256 (-),score=47.00 TRINITY_DN2299_c0_g1_i1:505-1272(-)